MAVLLLLETAAEICSVALCRDGKIVAVKNSEEPRAHAAVLAVFIDEILKENSLTVQSLDAIAVSKGPGSYTGLRIGVATAKGLCYTAQKPLLGIDTLLSMALDYTAQQEVKEDAIILSLLDARRDEVYAAAYNKLGEIILPVQAIILDQSSFMAWAGKNVIVIGDGAAKAEKLLNGNLKFRYAIDFRHTAAGMAKPAYDKFMTKEFEDVAYFEPFYLKEFAGALPKPRTT